jgi:hypothetical protein
MTMTPKIPYGKNTRLMSGQMIDAHHRDPAGVYDGPFVTRDRFHWARLLTFVTGLVNQELLLRNEYLAAENRILTAGEFLNQAAIGVSYKPRQCGRQRYESRPIGDVPSPVAGSGNRPSSPACVRYPL